MPAGRAARPKPAQGRQGYDRPRGNSVTRLYHGETNFDFINRWKYWFALSGTIIAIGLVALGARGLNFSIDFKGGTEWSVPTTASVATVKAELAAVDPALTKATIIQLTNRSSGKTTIEVELPASVTSNTHLENQVTTTLAKIAGVPVDQVTFDAVGPSWGSSITNKAIEAVIVFVILIFLAIAVYFETKMAIAAIVALLHDMLVTIGIYALSGFQVSPDTVIAFLTVLGYSLYDTIVVFDKVKENTKGLASTNRVTYTDVVNLSMNQVLARSINTSFVAVMPVFCILFIGSWIIGASALNDFGLALFIGLLSGAYSSIFIASPVLALLKEREPRYVEIRRRLAAYPQSRQVLTAATVAGGSLIGTRAASRAAELGRTEPGSGGQAGRGGAGELAGTRSAGRGRHALGEAGGPSGGLLPEPGAGYGYGPEEGELADLVGTVGGNGADGGGGNGEGGNGEGGNGEGGNGEGGATAGAGAGNGVPSGVTAAGEAGPAGEVVSRERASGTGAGAAAGGSAGAGPATSGGSSAGGSRTSGGRPVPPRPRPKKKAPRRR